MRKEENIDINISISIKGKGGKLDKTFEGVTNKWERRRIMADTTTVPTLISTLQCSAQVFFL